MKATRKAVRIGQRKGDRPPANRTERWLVSCRRYVNLKTIGGTVVAIVIGLANVALDRWDARQSKIDEQYYLRSREFDMALELKRLCAQNPKISERCK